jgi:hypothetical protein
VNNADSIAWNNSIKLNTELEKAGMEALVAKFKIDTAKFLRRSRKELTKISE